MAAVVPAAIAAAVVTVVVAAAVQRRRWRCGGGAVALEVAAADVAGANGQLACCAHSWPNGYASQEWKHWRMACWLLGGCALGPTLAESLYEELAYNMREARRARSR